MALFIVRHQHDAARCPASDPGMGATLLNYLSRPNVRKHGIEIQGEAIVRGEHTLYMIVEAADEARVRGAEAVLRRILHRFCEDADGAPDEIAAERTLAELADFTRENPRQ